MRPEILAYGIATNEERRRTE